VNYADYYHQTMREADDMNADEVLCDENEHSNWNMYSDEELIAAVVDGNGGPGDVGHELAYRGILHRVPGNDWGLTKF
jgi:hypothetical protein